jgi:hypothetical protein
MLTYLHLASRSRMVELYFHSPTRLHGIMFNKLSTGTTLPYRKNYEAMKLPIMLFSPPPSLTYVVDESSLRSERFQQAALQSITEKCGQIWVRVPHTETRKIVHINMCPTTFNLWIITERIL